MKTFTVKILNQRGSPYTVKGYSMEQVWLSEKCWFSFGAEVEITDTDGGKMVFMK